MKILLGSIEGGLNRQKCTKTRGKTTRPGGPAPRRTQSRGRDSSTAPQTEPGVLGETKTQELAGKMQRERGASYSAAAAAASLQSCPTLCGPIDGSPPGSSVRGILQARALEWDATSFSNTWKWKVKVKSLSRVWLCDPIDDSPPGSSIHGIFQARVVEWGAIA